MNLLNLTAAAAKAGVSVPTASKIARRLNLGLVIGGRRVGFTAKEVNAIKRAAKDGPGRPKKA